MPNRNLDQQDVVTPKRLPLDIVDQPLLDELAALVDPLMFKGTPDDLLSASALGRRNAARAVVRQIARAAR